MFPNGNTNDWLKLNLAKEYTKTSSPCLWDDTQNPYTRFSLGDEIEQDGVQQFVQRKETGTNIQAHSAPKIA